MAEYFTSFTGLNIDNILHHFVKWIFKKRGENDYFGVKKLKFNDFVTY